MSKQKLKILFLVMPSVVILFVLFFLFLDKSSSTNNLGQVDEVNTETVEKTDVISDNSTVEIEEKKYEDYNISELNNSFYSEDYSSNLKGKIQEFTKEGNTDEQKYKAVYLYSFVGDYENAKKLRNELCKNSDLTLCGEETFVLTSYVPYSTTGNRLNGVSLSIDGENLGDLKGNNKLDVESNFIHRIKLSKKGYLDFFMKATSSDIGTTNLSINPKLLEADTSKTVSIDEGLEFSTDNFTFNIEPNTFTKQDGSQVKGNIDIYFFDIGSQDGDLNVLNLDAFNSEDYSYLGGSMVTFGMPYIKAYSGNEELVINKEIIGTGKIQNIDKSVGYDLKNVTKGEYLDEKSLSEYNIPPFWLLDSQNGVWYTSLMKILDEDGNYEFKLK